jgi:hypothetical protein
MLFERGPEPPKGCGQPNRVLQSIRLRPNASRCRCGSLVIRVLQARHSRVDVQIIDAGGRRGRKRRCPRRSANERHGSGGGGQLAQIGKGAPRPRREVKPSGAAPAEMRLMRLSASHRGDCGTRRHSNARGVAEADGVASGCGIRGNRRGGPNACGTSGRRGARERSSHPALAEAASPKGEQRRSPTRRAERRGMNRAQTRPATEDLVPEPQIRRQWLSVA